MFNSTLNTSNPTSNNGSVFSYFPEVMTTSKALMPALFMATTFVSVSPESKSSVGYEMSSTNTYARDVHRNITGKVASGIMDAFEKYEQHLSYAHMTYPEREVVKKSVIVAKQFASQIPEVLFNKRVPIPHFSIADEESVNFFWENNDTRLDLVVEGDKTYYYYARLANGDEMIVNSMPIGTKLPLEVLNALAS